MIHHMHSGLDSLTNGAQAALLSRCRGSVGQLDSATAEAASRYISQGNDPSLMGIARTWLRAIGHPHANAAGPIVAQAFLASDGTANGRGDHADLLSGLAGKILTGPPVYANVTYPQWCERIEDLPDFKPKNFIDVGVFNQLDAIAENKKFQELQFQSQLQTWIRAERYGNKVGLTVEMVVDDDLNGFVRQLRSLRAAVMNTIQRHVLELLILNPTMLDGNAFFSAAHNNLVSAGSGAPSKTQLTEHRRLHRLQTSFGSNQPMGASIDMLLGPATLEEDIRQTITIGFETKTPAVDANINTFRGLVTPVIDAHLDAYSTSVWYTLIDPMLAPAIVYAFQSGYGEEGQRDDWYDPDSKTRFVSVETRFGVALSNYRAIVRNDG